MSRLACARVPSGNESRYGNPGYCRSTTRVEPRIDYRSQSRVSKTRTHYKNTTRRLLIQSVCHGITSGSFGGSLPYFLWLAFRLRQTLHALQTLVTRGPSPMKVKCCLSVSSNLFVPGCSRCVWYHSVTLRSRDLGMTILSSRVISSYVLSGRVSKLLLGIPAPFPWVG